MNKLKVKSKRVIKKAGVAEKKSKIKVSKKNKTSASRIVLTSKQNNISILITRQKENTKPDQKTVEQINAFTEKLNIELKKKKINAEASVGGSIAKGTFIKSSFDADIFVKFDVKYRGQKISDILGELLKSMKLDANRVHGSRDYFQIKKEFTYELVPVLHVKDYREAENVADMSPLHVNYFVKQSKKIKNLREEVRITKLFMKSARVYGAESYIKGFSGHVVDLLLIKYKTFLDLVNAAAKWKDELIIDLEKYHIDPKMSLNNSKISGPLIIVDPIQKNRNAAAAVSKECFDRFRERCREFIKNPSDEFFELPNFSEIIDKEISKNKNQETIILNISPLEGKRDVIGSKVLKIKEYLEQNAKEEGFELLWSDWEFGEKNSRICFILSSKLLSSVKIIRGPPQDMKESAEQFKKAHKKTFSKDNYVFAEEKRKFISPFKFLEQNITNKYIKEKCKSISIVQGQKA